MDSSHHILAARHMKDGKIERGLNFIQNRLTPLLKKIPDSVINVFFGYTNGDYNDKNIKYGQMSMAARNEEYSGRFDKKDIIDNEYVLDIILCVSIFVLVIFIVFCHSER